ncbi:MAG: hypothetical protein U0L26_11000 [Cellulosilyticum sp.]|nr:hypothetical protein [Cellulosilyticum sp.]
MEHLEGAKQYPDRQIYCNCCGRVINVEGKSQEDFLRVKKIWSYFSSKDLTGHTFNVCEACYDEMISRFKIPVEEFFVDDIPVYTDEEIERLNAAYAAQLCK